MRKLLFIAVSIIAFQIFAQEKSNSQAIITFEEQFFDFGDIKQGDKVQHSFKFKNTGNDSLRLSNVLTTCGCTTPSWPKQAIAPGESGEILASFNSTGKMGFQNKVVTVMSNASNSQTTFTIKANVLPVNQTDMTKPTENKK